MQSTPPKATVIKARYLQEQVKKDPNWIAKNATFLSPIHVQGECVLSRTPIRKLSPFITFLNKAHFVGCKALLEAAGNYRALVDFSQSGIKTIHPKLTVTLKNKRGYAAKYTECSELIEAAGTYHGAVDFTSSSIRRLDPSIFRVLAPNMEGVALLINHCWNLEDLTGTFPGAVYAWCSGIKKVSRLVITDCDQEKNEAAYFFACVDLKEVSDSSFHGAIALSKSGVEIIRNVSLTHPSTKTVYLGDCILLKWCQDDIIDAALHNPPIAKERIGCGVIQCGMSPEVLERLVQARTARKILKQREPMTF